jgi:hypothetical protein
MRKTAFVVACVAFAGNGRRVFQFQGVQQTVDVEEQQPTKSSAFAASPLLARSSNSPAAASHSVASGNLNGRGGPEMVMTNDMVKVDDFKAKLANVPAEQPPQSPLTAWGDRFEDIRKVQAEARAKPAPEFPRSVHKADVMAADADKDAELAWFLSNAKEIKDDMERSGAVVFRDFSLMKEQEGFEAFYNAIGMKPCLDPLFSVSARPTANGDKTSAVYEAVNKESRKNFFIGMHNEFVGTRAPRAAAFVSFKAAETGGEFLIADGRAVFRDLDPDVLERLYRRNIRYSVMELPLFGWVDSLPKPLQSPTMNTMKALASAAINAKVDFSVELLEQRGGYDQTRLLQARAPSQVPILRHPVTNEPTWFCNVHSHSAKLRKNREDKYGAEKFTEGASEWNKSDFFFGDDGDLTDAELKHLDEITNKNIKYIKMKEGDVVLLDNYKTMHGRNVFDGTRKHAVAWFGGWEGEDEQRSRQWNL